MTSVWKRLQRVGKKASKFQFSASYQSLTVECVRGGKWQPNKLVVVWTRRKRRKLTKPMSWQPGISNPFRGIIVWPEPDPIDINVTLYKDSKPDSVFEDKEWTFVIEDESQTGRRKPIATGAINMVDYVSVESRTFDITLTMKVASKKLLSASLEFTLSCVLIKEGMATDDDMISIGSMMSLNDDYYLDDNDDDMEVVPSPRLRHKRNLSSGNMKVLPVIRLQESADGRSHSPTGSPVLGKEKRQRGRIRSKSALGENVKTVISDVQKEDAAKRLSTGSDVSSEISDSGQEVSKDKSKMESELIKWARSRTKGYRGVKVKNMTTSWRDGLAFCAILHSFHPDKVDFSSLNPQNIKDNNKLAFTAFEKLGIPRLLEPTQMMFSPVPDKLSVMTYVFQIKSYFSRPPGLPPSPLSIKTPAPQSRPAPRSRPAPPPPVSVASEEEPVDIASKEEPIDIASKEEPIDIADVNLACNFSDIDNSSEGKQKTEAYNPFLDDDEEVQMDSMPDVSSNPSATTLRDANETSTSSVEKETVLDSSSLSSESKSLDNDVSGVKVLKPPPKPPRLYQTTESSSGDTNVKTTDAMDKKDKSESKGYNPFDEDETQDFVSNKKSASPSKLQKPPSAYNPFDDDEGDASADLQEQTVNDNETKHGYNPFDDDDDDVTPTKKVVENHVGKKEKGKKKVSYPHIFNPFEEDNFKSSETDNTQKATSKDNKSYNPFDDDNDDDEGVSNDTNQVESSTRKSSLETKGKHGQGDQTGRASPSGLTKSPGPNKKKRQAPPPPVVRSSDDPWTARLPDDVTTRRRRGPRPTTPGSTEQTSPHTSPARRGPKRTAPTPPRRPPLIPSFDEWKTDRSSTGNNDRSAVSSSAENTPSKMVSTDKGEKTQTPPAPTSDDSGSKSPKVSRTDGANQADIKLLARQVLMDARKKAGASNALPRERVAEIAKTAKGPIADKTSMGSATSGSEAQDKETVDDQEAIRKKENLRLRKEELQRRKKANEKAQKMVQNAMKENAQKLPSSVETKSQEGTDTGGENSDQKPVKNKNLEHRPLKLKDKESESHKRRPSTENDSKSPPDKAGFKESEELQRIRQILNQGKKDIKPSNSENTDQESGAVKSKGLETARESKRKVSDGESSKHSALNGLSDSPQPTPPSRAKVRGPNAGLQAYVESRKMNFEMFEVPPVRTEESDEQVDEEGKKDNDTGEIADDQTKDHEASSLASDEQESQDQSREFQDTSEYVRHELKSLEEQQQALDKVGEKLEIELRRAMGCKGCEEEQEKLMQDWFLLVNKKNELVRRQAELNLLKNEEDLERTYDMLQRELRALAELEDWQKTEKHREREAELIEQLVLVVNKRDQLVQFEDSQLQQAEKDALHVQKVIDNARIPKDKNSECVLQ